MKISNLLLHVVAVIMLAAVSGFAQDTLPTSAPSTQPAADEGILPLPDYTGDIWDRSTLTGDWGGARSELAAKGLTLDAYVTQVYQGPFSGGRNEDDEYGGRANVLFNLDTGRMGLWPGGLFTVEGEGKFGKTANSNTGALIPVNSNGLFPQPSNDAWAIPSIMFTQFLSEQTGVFFGKIDTMSGDDNAFAHGKGNEQFMNLAFGINPAALLSTPYSTLGGGVILLPTKDIQVSFLVYDPNGEAGTSGFSNPYKNGPGYALEGRITGSPALCVRRSNLTPFPPGSERQQV
jgi:porin